MAKETILRIPRSDSPGDFILVKVTRPGSSELDLKLVATEGEAPYRGSVKSAQIDKLRAKNYHGADDEWTGILAYALGQKQSASVPEKHKSGLEIAATVKQDEDDESEKDIVISLRKRIDTITQRLGTISLKQDDDQAIQLFDWTGMAVARADGLEDELASLTAKYDALESTINKLNSQLKELIKAKTEHEDQLIAKFAQLLNEKKLKIRNQQRLLASAKIDPSKVDEMSASAPSETGSTKRRGKRKAEEPAVSSESEGGFDTMDVDKARKQGKANRDTEKEDEGENEDLLTESDGQETPDPLEDETATEDEADEPTKAPSPPPTVNGGKRATRSSSKQPTSSTTTTRKTTTSSPPPRRELPFTRKRGPVKPTPVVGDDSDEDDEL
ncbi:hypothetical protein RJZ56_006201 [Blastomyces dermatitidis]|uniref:XRCC4 coiled-coil domain-containing protein n=2 Tax=Ajellomyces dermatitidis TaxID=5039 RepID=F2TQA3_AJEDA|nr:uncharacterized protein BDCG_07071 [Blastomyces dermatitidis ER-3]EEQ91951.1 hypothetical protein BDCG_07071 [Blastomyces dermatitidis ER-3]EGE85416.1 hypothetical protein BDDG_08361 [Blastomyces dermatitidis ATCC 18188]EQL33937.1 hypothetical protein BDFG_04091 [Blastomyces dermatitidis ATCC 26199]